MLSDYGANVSFNYANIDDCIRYGIRPIPWLWGEYWAKERINHKAEIIGRLVKNKNGFYIYNYMKVNQPHPFHNLLIRSGSLPFHVLYKTVPIYELLNLKEKYDHFISWNAFDCLVVDERIELLGKIESLLNPEGTIVLSFRHFFNLSDAAQGFFNSDFLKQQNNQYPSHVNVKEIIVNNKFLRLASSSKNIDYAYGFDNYDEQDILSCADILSPFFFSLVDKSIYKDFPDAIKTIESCRVGNVGLFLRKMH